MNQHAGQTLERVLGIAAIDRVLIHFLLLRASPSHPPWCPILMRRFKLSFLPTSEFFVNVERLSISCHLESGCKKLQEARGSWRKQHNKLRGFSNRPNLLPLGRKNYFHRWRHCDGFVVVVGSCGTTNPEPLPIVQISSQSVEIIISSLHALQQARGGFVMGVGSCKKLQEARRCCRKLRHSNHRSKPNTLKSCSIRLKASFYRCTQCDKRVVAARLV